MESFIFNINLKSLGNNLNNKCGEATNILFSYLALFFTLSQFLVTKSI